MSEASSGKKGILVVSFGTSYEDTRKLTIEAIESKIKNSFQEYEIRRAFTSGIIRKKIKRNENIHIDSTKEALDRMKADGFNEVIVQPLHIIPGIEYDAVKETVNEYTNLFDKIIIGTPLLYEEKEYEEAVSALKNQISTMKSNEGVVLMGHGTTHYSNACYALLQYILEESELENIFVGTVEGYPTLDNVIRRLKKNKIDNVVLMPFMLVAGDHANNDMSGDEEDSWKNILKNNGIQSTVYLHGLGENLSIQDIYIEKIKNLLL
ncbi:sirohydrochlorin cobaltochelatase [Haloimpatiens massiliensis]|uniref:sirohydrochlorin cobaltochelatase n=1 Tax=Haloimpatiens massiliensis TaxID=1658110 RepID=UPI000C853CB0|nr:sirohydrochlorin cobaltochelatase [Haloimpatiens massiliensis]